MRDIVKFERGRSLKVEKNPNQAETEETSVCAVCGEEFNQPLLAELHSEGMIEEYYACPRCLTKVGEVDPESRMEPEEPEEIEEEPELALEETPTIEAAKPEETQPCPYHLGYLKTREKSSPIPEGCFTCTKMIDCLKVG